jgi:hypothetical protein
MVGSQPREFVSEPLLQSNRLYSIKLPGRTLWGWERRDAAGEVVACSEQLFMDYVACFCDAQRTDNTL